MNTIQTTMPVHSIQSSAQAYKTSAEHLGQTFQSMLSDTVNTMQKGENAMMSAASGGTDILSTLVAVNNAEAAINTLVGIRDRIVNAYNETMHMAI